MHELYNTFARNSEKQMLLDTLFMLGKVMLFRS
jgi:hypothetical protein